VNKVNNWFKDWFNSEHYHLLYKNRDFTEAEQFIRNLLRHLQLRNDAQVMDLACGKGRHAIQVNELGFNVLGIDLSEESIAFAKQFSKEGLKFETGDMRNLGHLSEFDLVLNLFTSFGYFREEGENAKVINSIADSLKSKGTLVLDYLNVNKVIPALPNREEIKREEITFHIKKKIEDGFIVKDIQFVDQQTDHNYQEFVKLIRLKDFENYFSLSGMKIVETFGNYNLEAFDAETSDRLILIAEKE